MSSLDYVRNTFTFNRLLPFPSIFAENKTAVTADVLEAGWIVAFITLFFSFIILVPAIANKEKHLYVIRITLITFIGLTIMLCNFGQEWEVGRVSSAMYYRAGSKEEINATVGLKLGLRSVNVTLYAPRSALHGDLSGEKVDYNERFTWAWEQGRAGFGPFAGQVQRDFRAGQLRGLPYPILWAAEYFTFDGEGLRFGRHYRHAGWFAHIFVWCAFVCWLLAVLLFKVYILYGAVLLAALGCCLLVSAIIWASIRNFVELAIVFNDEAGGLLTTHYGVHWYLAVFVGTFCLLSGVSIGILDQFYHNELCLFFGLNPFTIIDEEYFDDEVEESAAKTSNEVEMKGTKEFGGRRQKTVRYKPRGTKKYWKNKTPVTEHVVDNSDYFNIDPLNSQVLHQTYVSDQQHGSAYQQHYQYQQQQFQGYPQPSTSSGNPFPGDLTATTITEESPGVGADNDNYVEAGYHGGQQQHEQQQQYNPQSDHVIQDGGQPQEQYNYDAGHAVQHDGQQKQGQEQQQYNYPPDPATQDGAQQQQYNYNTPM